MTMTESEIDDRVEETDRGGVKERWRVKEEERKR